MPKNSSSLQNSIHFSLEEVAEGIFAAIAAEEGGAMGNAGIIDLGDRTVIFDSFETPFAAEDLRVASEFLTGRQAAWVVNSHSHSDHWFGNQVFPPEAIVIATQKSTESMKDYLEEVEDEKSDPSELKAYLQDQVKLLEVETDQNKRRVLKSAIARWKFNLESLPYLDLRLPDQSFSGEFEINGSRRNAKLIDAGTAHSPGDCYLSIPSESIVFLGDIGFFHQLPYMADCEPGGWIAVLEELKTSSYQVFIPGHGPAGSISDLNVLEEYIEWLKSLVMEAIDKGITIEEVISSELPEPYRSWSIGSPRMEINTKLMFAYLSR